MQEEFNKTRHGSVSSGFPWHQPGSSSLPAEWVQKETQKRRLTVLQPNDEVVPYSDETEDEAWRPRTGGGTTAEIGLTKQREQTFQKGNMLESRRPGSCLSSCGGLRLTGARTDAPERHLLSFSFRWNLMGWDRYTLSQCELELVDHSCQVLQRKPEGSCYMSLYF